MWIVRLALRRPYTIAVMSLLILVLGTLSLSRMVVDVFPALFRRTIDETTLGLATGESLAHLNYLLARGLAARTTDAAGVDWYQAVD